MLNLYAVKLWHASEPRYIETIEVRTYNPRRAEHLAVESYPGCRALAEAIDTRNGDDPSYLRPTVRAQ